MIATPELDKMRKVRKESQAIGDFLEWLRSEKGWFLAEWSEDEGDRDTIFQARYSIESLLAEFFKIDADKAEMERRQLLEELRRLPRGSK